MAFSSPPTIVLKALRLIADPDKRAVFNDTGIEQLGRLVLRDLTITGRRAITGSATGCAALMSKRTTSTSWRRMRAAMTRDLKDTALRSFPAPSRSGTSTRTVLSR